MNAGEVSLQGHLDELRAETNIEDGGLSTVIFCGKMKSEHDSADVLAMHRTVVEAEVNSEGTNVTGLLMGQGSSVMHFIEGSSHAVLRILKVIADHEHFHGTRVGENMALQQGRIVYSVESRPKRYFPEWYSCVLPEKKGSSEELNGETGKDVVSDLAQTLLDMGTKLQGTSGGGGAVEMSEYAEVLPAKGLILALNNCNAFFTLDDFVALHAEPFHVDMESEAAYPLRRLVSY